MEQNPFTQTKKRKKHGCLWSFLITLGVFILLGIVFVCLSDTEIQDNSIYKLSLSGTVVEQAPAEDEWASLLNDLTAFSDEEVVGLDQILASIHYAKNTEKILGIYLSDGEMAVAPASAKAIRDALVDFKTSGKWIIAYSDSYNTLSYYIASVADTIILNPTGSLSWNGLTAQKMYYTRLMKKIGVEMQILKVGSFKSAVEPFFRTSMSSEDSLQTMQYLDGIWTEIRDAVALSRGIPASQLDAYADQYMELQPESQYLQYRLVDQLLYKADVRELLAEKAQSEDYTLLSTSELASYNQEDHFADKHIAVLYAEGEIFDDSGEGIVAKKMEKIIQDISEDDAIQAVVLRVNSPGGSATASEQIWYALHHLQKQGKPVVVSMGDYAASGGYYISCGADYIFAEPTTLTGSIGIFGTIPNISQLRDTIGLDIDGVSTHQHSDLMTHIIQEGMSPSEHLLLQSMVERGYDLFTRRCAEGRHLSQDSIKAIGEGRVWLGKDALQIGLVDEMGGIQSAIQKAAQLADIEDYSLVYYPEPLTFWDELFSENDASTTEEKLIAQLRTFFSKPRIMALMPAVEIH